MFRFLIFTLLVSYAVPQAQRFTRQEYEPVSIQSVQAGAPQLSPIVCSVINGKTRCGHNPKPNDSVDR